MLIGDDAVGIIGVIRAVFSLAEASSDINEMRKSKRFSVIHFITAAASTALAVV